MTLLLSNKDIPDRLWYDSKPEILVDVRGDGVDAIIERIDTLARSYPYRDDYTLVARAK